MRVRVRMAVIMGVTQIFFEIALDTCRCRCWCTRSPFARLNIFCRFSEERGFECTNTDKYLADVSAKAGNWVGYRLSWPNEADDAPGHLVRATVMEAVGRARGMKDMGGFEDIKTENHMGAR